MRVEKASIEARLIASTIVLFGVGASMGAFVYLLNYDRLVDHVLSNAMDSASRSAFLVTMGAVGALTAFIPLAYAARRGLSDNALSGLTRLARILLPLLPLFVLPVLFDYRWTQKSEWTFVLSAGLLGLGFERSLRVSLSAIDWTGSRLWFSRMCRVHPWLLTRLPALLVALLAVFTAGYFAHFTVLNHWRLGTQAWDLAIFDNMMWNLIRGSWFFASPDLGREGSHIQFHATFLAYLFAPFYALYQRAESLLVMQAVLVAAAAVPFFLLARRKLGSAWAGLVFAYAYLVHAPMHAPVFYDFHFLTTAPFWVGWVLYFYETERKVLLVIAGACALLLREDVSAGLAAAALFMLLNGSRPRWAMIGGIVSAVYFVIVKFYIMPLHTTWSGAHSFAWMFQSLIPPGESGFQSVLRTMGSNPVYTFNAVLEQDKLTYIVKMFGPFLLLPLRHPRTWILFIPPAMFTLLSSGYKPLYQTLFQYTANYTSYIIYGSIVTLSWWRQSDASLGLRRYRVPAALIAILLTATVYSYSHGAILQRNSFVAGFQQIKFEISPEDEKRHRDLYDLIAMIPKDASVAVTELEAPHLSARKFCFTMRFSYDDADYLLINIDEVTANPPTRDMVKKALDTKQYGFVTQRGTLLLWKRHYDQAKNGEGRRLLHLSISPARKANSKNSRRTRRAAKNPRRQARPRKQSGKTAPMNESRTGRSRALPPPPTPGRGAPAPSAQNKRGPTVAPSTVAPSKNPLANPSGVPSGVRPP